MNTQLPRFRPSIATTPTGQGHGVGLAQKYKRKGGDATSMQSSSSIPGQTPGASSFRSSPSPLFSIGVGSPRDRTPSATPAFARPLSAGTRQGQHAQNPKRRRSSVRNRRSTPTPRTPRTPRAQARTPRSRSSSHRTPASSSLRTPAQSARSSSYLVAICEWGRKRQEVGIAAMNLSSPELVLYQFPDNHTYTNTTILLKGFDPREILISETQTASKLAYCIDQQFDLVRVVPLKRKYFNEDSGIRLIEKYAYDKSALSSALSSQNSQYLSLSACSCLMQYIEFIASITFAPRSLKVSFRSLEGYMRLDVNTIKNLEIVSSRGSRRKGKQAAGRSLFGILNSCQTAAGARLLRQSLIQPLSDLPTINMRLSAVEELLQRERTFFAVLEILPQMVDIGSLCSSFVQVPVNETHETAQNSVSNVLLLKRVLKLLPKLTDALAASENQLLVAISKNLNVPARAELLACIDDTLEEEAVASSKGNASKWLTQLAFAVKAEKKGLLHVARETYINIVEQIFQEVEQYKEALNMPSMKVSFNNSRGFYVSFPKALLEMDNIPPDLFLQRVTRGTMCHCTTDMILSLDLRRRNVFAEVMVLTGKLIHELLGKIRRHIGWLTSVAEAVALLDMLMAFANIVTLQDWVKPVFLDNPDQSTLAIHDGRHAIKEQQQGAAQFIANSTLLNPQNSVHIISGPNSAGKSTYLKQVGVMVILAHIGCFVPATRMLLTVMDQVLTRFSMEDSFEHNSGTFLVEMREVAHILHNATPRCLVLVDELGRGTGNTEGIGLAWTITEELLRSNCLTLLATHYHELHELADIYPRVTSMTIDVSTQNHEIIYKYKVVPRTQSNSQEDLSYGIALAEAAKFPPDTISLSRVLSSKLRQSVSGRADRSSRRDFIQLMARVMNVRQSSLPLGDIREYLRPLQQVAVKFGNVRAPTPSSAASVDDST